MKHSILFFLFLCCFFSIHAQTFDTFSLYFEDANGNRDTLPIEKVEGATIFIDEELEEENLKEVPLNGFDVRFFRFKPSNINKDFHITWSCGHQDGNVSAARNYFIEEYYYETKRLIYPKWNCTPANIGVEEKFFIPKDAAFPVKVSWDRELLQDECHRLSFFTEVMPRRLEQETPCTEGGFKFCRERINHPLISLNDSSSVSLVAPNFQTMERLDTTLVSVYYLKISNNPLSGSVSTQDILNDEVSLYPNPNVGEFFIDGASLGDKIEVYDIQGRLMKEESYSGGPLRVNEKGVFLVLVHLDEGVVKKKVVCY